MNATFVLFFLQKNRFNKVKLTLSP